MLRLLLCLLFLIYSVCIVPVEASKTKKNNTTQQIKPKEKINTEAIKLEEDKTNTEEKQLENIVQEKNKEKGTWIDTVNFIQPSLLSDNPELQAQADLLLTRAEQEQLLVLWRATLERNKTIQFIVQKLSPATNEQKRAQVLSQVLNTAVFLPFYALQSVAPGNGGAIAGVVGAGVAGDIISGSNVKNKDRMALSQTEMVIMFMMIDSVAERVREEYRNYKEQYIDLALLKDEIEQAKNEARASLDLKNPQAQFLTQIRLRQLERESRRIQAKLRSSRVTLLDLCGVESLNEVEGLINKEIKTML